MINKICCVALTLLYEKYAIEIMDHSRKDAKYSGKGDAVYEKNLLDFGCFGFDGDLPGNASGGGKRCSGEE